MERRTNNLDNTSSRTKKRRFLYTCNFLKDLKKDLKIRFICTYYIISNYFLLRFKIINYELDPNLDVLKNSFLFC